MADRQFLNVSFPLDLKSILTLRLRYPYNTFELIKYVHCIIAVNTNNCETSSYYTMLRHSGSTLITEHCTLQNDKPNSIHYIVIDITC